MVSVMLSPSSQKPQSSNVAYMQNYSQQQSYTNVGQEGQGFGTYSPINVRSNERLVYTQGFE